MAPQRNVRTAVGTHRTWRLSPVVGGRMAADQELGRRQVRQMSAVTRESSQLGSLQVQRCHGPFSKSPPNTLPQGALCADWGAGVARCCPRTAPPNACPSRQLRGIPTTAVGMHRRCLSDILLVHRMSNSLATCPSVEGSWTPSLLKAQRGSRTSKHVRQPASGRRTPVMVKKVDNSDAPSRTSRPGNILVSAGTAGQEVVPYGHIHRIPTTALNRLRRDERGSATAELAIAMPLVLLLLLCVAQFTVYLHASHIAQAAAAHGLSAARVVAGSAAAGQAQTNQTLAQLGGGPLSNTSVAVRRDADRAAVIVSGDATRVLPFLTLRVHAQAVGPVEKFTEVTP